MMIMITYGAYDDDDYDAVRHTVKDQAAGSKRPSFVANRITASTMLPMIMFARLEKTPEPDDEDDNDDDGDAAAAADDDDDADDNDDHSSSSDQTDFGAEAGVDGRLDDHDASNHNHQQCHRQRHRIRHHSASRDHCDDDDD